MANSWTDGDDGIDFNFNPQAVFEPNSTSIRTQLAMHWEAAATAEHASVAAFARHSMQLMALAAPMQLIRDAHEAALDEIRHARLSFALASRCVD